MSLFSTIIAVFIGIVGLALILLFLQVIIQALGFHPLVTFERRKLKAKVSIVEQYDNSTDSKRFLTLIDALYLDPIVYDQALIQRVHEHHLAILERILEAGQKKSFRVENIPILEDLMQNRTQILQMYFEKRVAKVRGQRTSKDKRDIPEWAKEEYEKQLAELKERLTTNAHSIRSQCEEALTALQKSGSQKELQVH